MEADEWVERAEKRLHAAETLFAEGIPEDALFMAHQAVELALKGVIIKKTGELAALAGFAGLEPAYAGVRYPDAPAVRPTPAEAQHNISLARTVVEWSQSQLK